jgi:hypothetical protein
MKIDQTFHHHTLVAQETHFGVPEVSSINGPRNPNPYQDFPEVYPPPCPTLRPR